MVLLDNGQQKRLADLIHNESRAYYSIISGAIIHKLALEEAYELARIIMQASFKRNVPLAYLLAVLRQESIFDPKARNPNLNKNPQRLLELTDYGIGQISGRNLIALFPDPSDAYRTKEEKTEAQILAIQAADDKRILIAEDPVWSVDHSAQTYRSLLDWVKKEFSGSDPLQLATMAYNAGRTGTRLIIRQQTDPKVRGYETPEGLAKKTKAAWTHVRRVMDHYKRYLKILQSP